MFTGEDKKLIEEGINPPDWELWIKFGEGLSPKTWKKFHQGKELIWKAAFETFCATVNQQSQYVEFISSRVVAEAPIPFPPLIEDEIRYIERHIQNRLEEPSPRDWEGYLQRQRLSIYQRNLGHEALIRAMGMGKRGYIEPPPFKVTVTQIYCATSKNNGGVYTLPLYARVSNGKSELDINWCTAYVSDDGFCELLLDIRPYSWLGNEVIFNGQQYRRFTIEKIFIEIALDYLESQHKKEFAGKKRIIHFGGSLSPISSRKFWGYFRRFQSLYPDKTEQDLAILALKETPFGRARISRGITEFSVCFLRGTGFEDIPDTVHVIRACRPEDWSG